MNRAAIRLCWAILLVAGCKPRSAFTPQPEQLRLDVIDRSLGSIERGIVHDGGGADPPSLELERALHASHDALEEARNAVKAREWGDGRAVDEKVRELRRQLEILDHVLVSAGVSFTPGLDAWGDFEKDSGPGVQGVR